MDFQSVWMWGWTLYCLATGIVIGWIWGSQQSRTKLEEELKWKKARVLALELDLERANSKWLWKE